MSDSIFQPVFLSWNGTEYEVPADKVMMLIATVEEIISLSDLTKPNPPFMKVARAYAAALAYAGARGVNAELIYSTYFTSAAKVNYSAAVNGLLMMMIPPESIVSDEDVKKPVAKKAKKAEKTVKS